jgi:hypothetical protein
MIARYAVMVKGPNGRKWFRADSASFGAKDIAEQLLTDCERTWGHTGLTFKLATEDEYRGVDAAPRKYRPWDTDPDEDGDVDLDSLNDSEL